ncbi:MAG: hypothetical protein LBR60_02325 [Fibrobacter sp.]|jgi:hypothetical protein|nr:hypothetical protein [Fibrobacter sp.]
MEDFLHLRRHLVGQIFRLEAAPICRKALESREHCVRQAEGAREARSAQHRLEGSPEIRRPGALECWILKHPDPETSSGWRRNIIQENSLLFILGLILRIN